MEWITLNTVVVTAVSGLIAYLVYQSLKPRPSPFAAPQRSGLLVAQDTGKSKQIQSKTGDASMAIEQRRRRTIQSSGKADPSKLKEATYQKGSTTGAMETYMLSSICPRPVPYDILYDGGDEGDEFCPYEGDGSTRLDAGNDTTKACGL
jgi:hypothetical protein